MPHISAKNHKLIKRFVWKPWPMSDGAANQAKTEAYSSSFEKESKEINTEFTAESEGSRGTAAGLRAVIGGIRKFRVDSNTVLIHFIRNLVVVIQQDTSKTAGDSSSDKAAIALLQTLETAFASQPPTSNHPNTRLWDIGLRQSVLHILETHSAYDKTSTLKQLSAQVIQQIRQQQPVTPEKMDSFRSPGDSSSYLQRGVADRLASGSDISDPSSIAGMLSNIGPACTRNENTLRETLSEISQAGSLGAADVAQLVHFFSGREARKEGEASSGLSSSILGSLLPGRDNSDSSDGKGWDLNVVSRVLATDYESMDWNSVALEFDYPAFVIRDVEQFRKLLEIYRAGAQRDPPLKGFTAQWKNTAGQCSLMEALLSAPPSVYRCPLDEAEMLDAATAAPEGQGLAMNPQGWASSEVLQRLLYLSDIPSLARRVRDLFVKGLLSCPEVILCALVRLQLNAANAAAHGNANSMVHAGTQMKGELMRELIPLFFKPSAQHRVQNAPAAIGRLWVISHTTVTSCCIEAWRSTSQEPPQTRRATLVHIIDIVRRLPSPKDAIASLLNGAKDPEFSVAMAFFMADNEMLQLKQWLTERTTATNGTSAALFAIALVTYLAKSFKTAVPRSGAAEAPLVSLENVATSIGVLLSLEGALASQAVPASVGSNVNLLAGCSTISDCVKVVAEACITTHPALRSSINVPAGGGEGQSGGGSSANSDEIEEAANSYFQKIYTSEQSIGEVVQMLKRFKTGTQREQDIFACMIHNLFDEYRFFAKYPEKELRITGILFGALIQEQLVNSITLGIALRYVLEALRKPPSPPGASASSSGKMFRFGMFALEQFKSRLHEWPQYCSHIVQIPHLKEGYADLVKEIETAMVESQNKPPSASSTAQESVNAAAMEMNAPGQAKERSGNLSDLGSPSNIQLPPPAPPAAEQVLVAQFGPRLGRAVNDEHDVDPEHEAPPDALLDRVQLLINNLDSGNYEEKAKELKRLLEPKYFGWLGNYLVVRRITTQPNHHPTYLAFLDAMGDYGKGLITAILSSVYLNIGKLLRSPKITTSTSERSLLKNLGSWLGQITLARNRPVLQIMLDCKELLYQGYENGMLIAVTPFVAKLLEGSKNSIVFRPPNPWLMGLLSVFRSLYEVPDLKMNIKFEVEVLCKNLGVKLDEITLRTDDLIRRIPPKKEKNPDFNLKASNIGSVETKVAKDAADAALRGPDSKGLALPEGTVIPNLASYVKLNASLDQLLQRTGTLTIDSVKRSVPVAVDRAIREIIQPVVERSVTIACITTKEIVLKDFAMEGDENKLRKAGQLMVSNLAGSLALVTCREPLRTSISTHLRQLLCPNGLDKLNDEEQKTVEQCVAICATDNVELGCLLIEKAATEKAVRDMDDSLAPAVNARRKHREQTGAPYFDLSSYGSGHRYPGALPEPLRPKPGGLRGEQLRVYEAFHRPARQPESSTSSGAGIVPPRPAVAPESVPGSKAPPGQKLNLEALQAIASKVDSAVTSILSAAGPRAPEVTLSMLPPQHEMRQLLSAVQQVIPNANPTGGNPAALSKSEKEAVLGFSQSIFKRLYELTLSEPLRLEALVALLENVNECCPQLGQDLGTWATYAPTDTEAQRKLHRTVLLLLVRSRLISVQDLDGFLSASADSGRNPVWLEFSLLFIRTALLERIASPTDFPKLMDLMAQVADGRSQASPQVAQSLRKPILRMMEEVHGKASGNAGSAEAKPVDTASFAQSSSLSSASLANLASASGKAAEATSMLLRNDPQNAKQQVTFLLDSWIRIQSEAPSDEKVLAQYLQLLQQNGIGKSDETTERFLRLSMLIVIEAVRKTLSGETLNYTVMDMFSRLLVLLVKLLNSGGPAEVAAQRISLLNMILGVAARSMMWECEKGKKELGGRWDQRPWFRLYLNLVMDLNSPDPELDPISPGILSVFGAAFHVVQPLVVPGFAFAWLELVSNRKFLPNLLIPSEEKGWNVAHQLLIDHFLFLEPHLRKGDLTPAIKKLYEGTLRVLLVLLHDFPDFLAGYHISLCNVIPENCIQLRNLILSAVPKGMSLPEPFTPNLKIDLLPEIKQNPVILSDVLGPLQDLRADLDAFLKDRQRGDSFVKGLLPRLYKEGTSEVDSARISSLVLYVGMQAIVRLQNTQIARSLAQTPEVEILQKLMELDDKGRYISLNAVANQLRFPSSHTHFFSCLMLFLFSESSNVAVKEQVTRVLVERLILHKPHPWGLLITFMELIKNQRYQFWSHPFTRCATEIEKMFESVARSCMAPGAQRSTAVGGDDQQ